MVSWGLSGSNAATKSCSGLSHSDCSPCTSCWCSSPASVDWFVAVVATHTGSDISREAALDLPRKAQENVVTSERPEKRVLD